MSALRRKIFVGCRELGLDEDTRRQLQVVATGKESLSDMTEVELQKVVDALVERGFKPSFKPGAKGRKRSERRDVRFIHVLWKLLGEAGKLNNPGRDGLNAFIRRRFGSVWGAVPLDVDDLRDWQKIDAVIQALIAWCRREGVEIDKERVRR